MKTRIYAAPAVKGLSMLSEVWLDDDDDASDRQAIVSSTSISQINTIRSYILFIMVCILLTGLLYSANMYTDTFIE